MSRPLLPMHKIDPALFEQVIFNLLDNAAKYAPPRTTIRMPAPVRLPTLGDAS